MKICILKGQDYRHNYFAKNIVEIEGIETLILTHKRIDSSRLKKMFFKSTATFFNRLSKYFFYSILKWNAREKSFFSDIKIEKEIVVQNYNNIETINMIKEFSPDLLAVFGTPIISNDIIETPKFGAINLHGGISPEYKGGNTIFWALYNNEIEKTGATIHYMLEKVDSGDILAKVYPDLNATDDEFSASAKTFKYAVEEFIRIIQHINKSKQKLYGMKQDGPGKLYLAKDRTILKEIIGFFKIRKNLKEINTDKKVEIFYE
jgi:methionyl-tRNA formyltransferase